MKLKENLNNQQIKRKWRKIVKHTLPVLFVLFFSSVCSFAQNDGEDVVIGKYHVISSKILNEERRILVHLPLGYEDTKLNYPVVYHLYGDFVMTYFADAVSIVERMHDEGKIPQVILIGVDNTDRYLDLRPVKRDGSPGGSENFTQFFKEELIPFVENNFRAEDYISIVVSVFFAIFILKSKWLKPSEFRLKLCQKYPAGLGIEPKAVD